MGIFDWMKNRKKKPLIDELTEIQANLSKCETSLKNTISMFSDDYLSQDNKQKRFTEKQTEKIKQNVVKTREDIQSLAEQFGDLKIENTDRKFNQAERSLIFSIADLFNSCEKYDEKVDEKVFGKVAKEPIRQTQSKQVMQSAGNTRVSNSVATQTMEETPNYLKVYPREKGKIYIADLGEDYNKNKNIYEMLEKSPSKFYQIAIDPNFSAQTTNLASLMRNFESFDDKEIKEHLNHSVAIVISSYSQALDDACTAEKLREIDNIQNSKSQDENDLYYSEYERAIKSYYEHYAREIHNYEKVVEERGLDFPSDKVTTRASIKKELLSGPTMTEEEIDELSKKLLGDDNSAGNDKNNKKDNKDKGDKDN